MLKFNKNIFQYQYQWAFQTILHNLIIGTFCFTAPKSQLFNVLIPKSVYIQYTNPQKKDSIDLILNAFQAQKWNAPAIENRKGNYKNSIRYFHPEDISLVEEASKMLEPFKYKNFKKIFMKGKNSVPKGQIEIWINNK